MYRFIGASWGRRALATTILLSGFAGASVLAGEKEWGPDKPAEQEELQQSVALHFDEHSSPFRLYSTNNPGYPRLTGERIILTPDNRSSAVGLASLRQRVRPPFTVEFQYSIFDDDGGNPWNSGDGVALLFGRRPLPRKGVPLPAGSARGQIPDGSGYGVHLSIYGGGKLMLTDGSGHSLASRSGLPIYNHGEWSSVRVEVETEGIRVYLNGSLQLHWRGRVDATYGGLALSAATGGADGQHAIRDLRVIKKKGGPARPDPAP